VRTAIVWLRQDLRLADNPALHAAAGFDRVVPLWIDETPAADEQGREHVPGAASRAWTHRSLQSLSQALGSAGTDLLLARGEPSSVLERLIDALGTASDTAPDDEVRVFWNRRYDPLGIARDKAIKQALDAHRPRTFNARLLHEPWEVLKKDGTPYRVYTPYWRAVARRLDEQGGIDVLAAPEVLGGWRHDAALRATLAENGFGTDVEALSLLPDHAWAPDLLEAWPIGEPAALQRLRRFLGEAVHAYQDARDLPGEDGTSRLSPALHHGELSPRQALAALCAGRPIAALGEGETVFAKELVWREFGAAMLYHFPDTLHEPLDRRFQRFEWNPEPDAWLSAWQRGRTGVPIVDAGMRQLYATGWMHNRVRMVVASYLIKNLLVDWRRGEAWFRDTLVDADLGSNTLGWQWAAGCGADAAPFFRVFNPVLQGEKFDRDGRYVRRWVPELARVDKRSLHKPWELSAAQRAGLDYPAPLVDLKLSRQRALDAFAALKQGG